MQSSRALHRTALALLASGIGSGSSIAMAQTAPPPQDYQQPPPGYQAPPPGYQQAPPPGYQQQPPPPGYQQPPPGGYPPPQAYAPPPGYAPQYAPPQHAHDGFYLRLHIGGGYAEMGSGGGYDITFKGAGASFGLALGGTIAPNLIIFGNLFGMGISDPSVTVNGADAGTASGTTTTIGGIGPGIAYYFDPYNMYISGTVAAMQFQTSDSNGNGTTYNSDIGYGFQAMFGKEWWVSQDWGVGAAAELLAAGGMKDKADPTIKWSGVTFSLVFSATYN